MATFSGDVHVLNGDTELRCKSLVVFYDEDTGGQNLKAADPGPSGERSIKRIEAKGNVIVVQKDQHATGDAAIFNMRENTVMLTGNVVVTRGAGYPAGAAADGRFDQRCVENGWRPRRRRHRHATKSREEIIRDRAPLAVAANDGVRAAGVSQCPTLRPSRSEQTVDRQGLILDHVT